MDTMLDATIASMRYEFTDLLAGTQYSVRARAVAEGSIYPNSEASQPVQFKTLDGDLAVPVVRVVDVGMNGARIEWDDVLNAITYELSLSGGAET